MNRLRGLPLDSAVSDLPATSGNLDLICRITDGGRRSEVRRCRSSRAFVASGQLIEQEFEPLIRDFDDVALAQ
jgi:hypothetical protein